MARRSQSCAWCTDGTRNKVKCRKYNEREEYIYIHIKRIGENVSQCLCRPTERKWNDPDRESLFLLVHTNKRIEEGGQTKLGQGKGRKKRQKWIKSHTFYYYYYTTCRNREGGKWGGGGIFSFFYGLSFLLSSVYRSPIFMQKRQKSNRNKRTFIHFFFFFHLLLFFCGEWEGGDKSWID